jgi:hypothetical protein
MVILELNMQGTDHFLAILSFQLKESLRQSAALLVVDEGDHAGHHGIAAGLTTRGASSSNTVKRGIVPFIPLRHRPWSF